MATPSNIEAGGNVVFGWIGRYGFQTVVALALVTFLIYQSVITDQRLNEAVGRVHELQVANRTTLLDTQARLADITRVQAEISRSQAEAARAQADTSRAMAEMARSMERLSDRVPNAARQP